MNAIEVDIRDTYFRPRYCTGWIYRLGILGETDISGQVHLSNSFAVFDVQLRMSSSEPVLQKVGCRELVRVGSVS
ncbi:hypothetical protein Acr_05g0004260 [Actinidia rufa]|uniref:Uncharacterized protein n=1 Tax=Actinidia rufa TaxID=165716 RepID=A0A7J0D7A8_9ERIC|nr:hypothetical protein Acr_00g0001670 [Actinidia rufa]GFY86787.1 hypothetical protein Acr_05g0004260 [Actinidia rufa]